PPWWSGLSADDPATQRSWPRTSPTTGRWRGASRFASSSSGPASRAACPWSAFRTSRATCTIWLRWRRCTRISSAAAAPPHDVALRPAPRHAGRPRVPPARRRRGRVLEQPGAVRPRGARGALQRGPRRRLHERAIHGRPWRRLARDDRPPRSLPARPGPRAERAAGRGQDPRDEPRTPPDLPGPERGLAGPADRRPRSALSGPRRDPLRGPELHGARARRVRRDRVVVV